LFEDGDGDSFASGFEVVELLAHIDEVDRVHDYLNNLQWGIARALKHQDRQRINPRSTSTS
jgi:hypothetical protein